MLLPPPLQVLGRRRRKKRSETLQPRPITNHQVPSPLTGYATLHIFMADKGQLIVKTWCQISLCIQHTHWLPHPMAMGHCSAQVLAREQPIAQKINGELINISKPLVIWRTQTVTARTLGTVMIMTTGSRLHPGTTCGMRCEFLCCHSSY